MLTTSYLKFVFFRLFLFLLGLLHNDFLSLLADVVRRFTLSYRLTDQNDFLCHI